MDPPVQTTIRRSWFLFLIAFLKCARLSSAFTFMPTKHGGMTHSSLLDARFQSPATSPQNVFSFNSCLYLQDPKNEVKDKDPEIISDQMRLTPKTDHEPDAPELPSPLVLFLAFTAFTSIWPLLAYVRQHFDFDVDTYLTMRSLLDDPSIMATDNNGIMELPKLSPAEELVGSIFGPGNAIRR